jgi:hypothetical protein
MASYPRMIKCCLFFCKTLISAWSGKRRSGSSRGLPLLVGSLDQSEGTRGGKSGDKRLRFRERKVTYLSGHECVCIALCKARITTVTFCALWGRKSGRKVGPKSRAEKSGRCRVWSHHFFFGFISLSVVSSLLPQCTMQAVA